MVNRWRNLRVLLFSFFIVIIPIVYGSCLTLQGVVGGVLIVTPNNIMFDPHKSDPLVIEHGCEEYGLICPMEEVMSVALYDDVSRMKLKDALPS